jgi:catechol 2,3-dioxygenase-like lactoylglutathione lyase family enzyme
MTEKMSTHAPTVVRVLLVVSDPIRSADWYKSMLGIEPLEVQTSPPHVILNTKGTLLVLHRGRNKKCEDPAYVHFRVDDFDSTVAALKAKGIRLGDVFSAAEGLRIVNFPDPDGHMLGIEGR